MIRFEYQCQHGICYVNRNRHAHTMIDSFDSGFAIISAAVGVFFLTSICFHLTQYLRFVHIMIYILNQFLFFFSILLIVRSPIVFFWSASARSNLLLKKNIESHLFYIEMCNDEKLFILCECFFFFLNKMLLICIHVDLWRFIAVEKPDCFRVKH